MDDSIPCVEMAWHNILAKPQESLVAHTWHVLSRLADQIRLRPTLAKNIGEPNLWHWLYWGTLLHDFGKCAFGFQAMLIAARDHRRPTAWGYRHEALSLAFVDWLFPRGNPDRAHVIAVIACHHKDAREIIDTYGYNSRYREYPEDDLASQLVEQVSPADQLILYRWLSTCAWEWAKALDFAPHIRAVQMPTEAAAREAIQAQSIHDAVEDLHTYTKRLTFKENEHAAQLGSILRGMILIADHAGSAESRREPFASLDLPSAAQTANLFAPNAIRYPHQEAAAQSEAGSVVLMAPTGSGKTESALLWLDRQAALDGASPSRTFYILPYQASMNTMHKRLGRHFAGKDQIGLQHGHADQAIYFSALNDDLSTETATVLAKMNENISRLHRYPLNIQSPYQMLKLPYQLKGHEALFANFQGGRFILDEIHAYEPRRLALIIGFIDFLRRYAAARFFIMSATMPTHVQQALKEAVPDLQTITAQQETFARFQRHHVHLLDGALSDESTLAQIQSDALDGKSILVCCNTVNQAKVIHALLVDLLPDHPIMLVHSRFNSKDRADKEREIMRQVGVGSAHHGPKPIVVATQVVEVSLNIDMDTLYTENAPLEALLQRFGRVNRARHERSLADVYVMRKQPDTVKSLYSPALLDATLNKLAAVEEQPIDEGAIGTWIDEIYVGAALDQWWNDYRESADRFASDILGTLRPFETDESIEDAFYEMFNGVEVLPAAAFDEYATLIEKGKALEATALLVPLRWAQYKRLSVMKPPKAWREQIKVGWAKKIYVYLVAAEYSSESGLDIEGAMQVDAPSEAD